MSIRSHKTARARGRRKRTELSEMVTRRARDTAALVASIRVHKADVGAALGRRFVPALRDGETAPDHELSLELAGRSVQLAFDRLDELDDRHYLAKAHRAHLAREVDRVAKQELYPQAVDVRRQIDAAFGREAGCDLHSFTGRTPRSAERLRQHVERAVSRLGNPHRVLPAAQTMAGEPVVCRCRAESGVQNAPDTGCAGHVSVHRRSDTGCHDGSGVHRGSNTRCRSHVGVHPERGTRCRVHCGVQNACDTARGRDGVAPGRVFEPQRCFVHRR